MNARTVVLAAGIALGVVELVAIFVESLYVIVGVVLLFGLLVWFWRRPASKLAVALLGLLFVAEIVYLGDYNWNSDSDRLMIIATGLVCGIGLIGVVAWFLQRRRTGAAIPSRQG
jgi:hypothetical protein